MTSRTPSTPPSGVVGKLIILREDHDGGESEGYRWINRPGLPVLVQQPQPEQSILNADTSLLRDLTKLMQVLDGWMVHSIGAPKMVAFGEEIGVMLVPEPKR